MEEKHEQISEVPGVEMRRKLYGVVAFLLVAFAIYIGYNLYGIAVAKSEYYRAKANDQQLDGFVINASRGTGDALHTEAQHLSLCISLFFTIFTIK